MSKAERKELAQQADLVRGLLDGLLKTAGKGDRAEAEMAVAGLGALTALLLRIGTDLNRIADAVEARGPEAVGPVVGAPLRGTAGTERGEG